MNLHTHSLPNPSAPFLSPSHRGVVSTAACTMSTTHDNTVEQERGDDPSRQDNNREENYPTRTLQSAAPSDEKIKKICFSEKDGPEHVLFVVQVSKDLLKYGKREDDFAEGLGDAIYPTMYTCFAIQSHAELYISVRKALRRVGINCSPRHLQVYKNCTVSWRCIRAICRADHVCVLGN